MALTNKLTAIADAIREKTNTTDAMTLDEMATAIEGITGGGGSLNDYIPEEAFALTGTCQYKFYNGVWDWFIEEHGDKITTTDMTNTSHMFTHSKVTEIPFELNYQGTSSTMTNMFHYCQNLLQIPKINNCQPNDMTQIFNSCKKLKEIPEGFADWFDWSYMEKQTSAYTCNMSGMFQYCCSLRSIPMDCIAHANPNATYSYSYFPSGFFNCYVLDELVGLPLPWTATWTSNAFSNTFGACKRLKNLIFATQEDGSPYVMNWKSQVIDLGNSGGNSVGFAVVNSYILDNSDVHGITADKEVKDDETYQALKDDPDWFTCLKAYSRYNHDSAVETINSLPDTSAYLAASGGTNTIKFLGAAGSATDGGAINTLTEEEIAVAAAKGWTVTLA